MENSQSSSPGENPASRANLPTDPPVTESPFSSTKGAQGIEVEQIKLIYTYAPIGFQIGALTVGIVVLVLWGVVALGWLSAWVGFMAVVTSPAFVVIWWLRHTTPPPDQIKRWRKLLIISYGLAGLGWGAMGFLLFPPASLAHQVFLVFIAGGSAAGGMTTLSSVPAVFLAYLLASVLPLILRLFLQGEQVPAAMGFMLLAFSGALFGISRHFYASLTESLKLRFENLDLVENLSAAKDQAEAANRAKSQFLANVSHELRTPMQGLLGTTELLLQTALADSQRKLAQILYSSGQALLTIINDVLDFSKIEAGKLELEAIDFNLHQTVTEVIELFAASASRKGLKLSFLIYEDVPSGLRGDPVRLRQILTNLIGNAIKFTESGEVIVGVQNLKAQAQSQEETRDWGLETSPPSSQASSLLYFAVRDTGIGIAPEAQTHIFEAFSQADGSTTRKYGGTGLGLSIAKQLTHLMGGEIGVESVVDKGSTFWFTVPLSPPPKINWVAKAPFSSSQERQVLLQLHPQVPSRARVLLAEDNPINQDVTFGMLENLGCQVDVVTTGRGVLAALSRASYDLVLMDCHMPEMDGFETTRILRAHEAAAGTVGSRQKSKGSVHSSASHLPPLASRHLPIIALTARALQGDRERCLTTGMDDYLSKPFTQEQLSALLQRWLPQAPAEQEEQHHAAAKITAPLSFSPQQPIFSYMRNASSITASPPLRPAVIDLQALGDIRGLQRENSPALLSKVIHNYLDRAPQLLAALHEAVTQHDASTVQKAAHSLKSSSATLGAATLAALCQDLETMGHQHNLENATAVLSAATAEYEMVRGALATELQKETRS
ncbi:MAG TPA: ATP-binding protein [Candidatus Binatia bacterium]|jgi:signal transduction histidine kinase/DNA-binding response OmpR family regulator/HPt (histidine-containing phosphotransfer) domain-containing protein|nr:ATP-binding protein [Candidatus Binatia bacterium]